MTNALKAVANQVDRSMEAVADVTRQAASEPKFWLWYGTLTAVYALMYVIGFDAIAQFLAYLAFGVSVVGLGLAAIIASGIVLGLIGAVAKAVANGADQEEG